MSNSMPWLPTTPETFPARQGAAPSNEGSPFAPPQNNTSVGPVKTEKAAVTAFIFGLGGLIIPFVPPIVALFLGLGARRNIKASDPHLRGSGLANAAIILGAVMLALNVLITLALFL